MQSNVSSIVSNEVGGAVSIARVSPVAARAAAKGRDVAVAAALDDNVIIHIRFRPDTTVWEIGECPDHLDKEEWFKLLCKRLGSTYATRAGGRGFFRLTRVELEALKARNPS